MGPQLRRRPAHRRQQVRRSAERLRCQHLPDFPRQHGVQSAGSRHQHRLSCRRIPQCVSAVPQGGQLCDPAADADPHRERLAADTVLCRRPEHHRQHQICRGGGDQQDFGVYVRVKDAVHHRHGAARQQSQRQHTAREAAGDREQQQRQAEQLFLPAVGQQRQQHTCRRLCRRGGQKAAPGQEHRYGIGAARQSRQQIPSPPEGHSRQPGGQQEQQIIHRRIQDKHAVHIYHRHGIPLLFNGTHYRAGSL